MTTLNMNLNHLSYSSTADTENNVLIEATYLYDQLLAGDVSVNFVCENTILDRVQHALATHIKSLENLRTAVLWIQYCEMIQLLRKLIKAERTGDWELHLQSVPDMLPYVALQDIVYMPNQHMFTLHQCKILRTHIQRYSISSKLVTMYSDAVIDTGQDSLLTW